MKKILALLNEFNINVLRLYVTSNSMLTRSEGWYTVLYGDVAVALGGVLSCSIWYPF